MSDNTSSPVVAWLIKKRMSSRLTIVRDDKREQVGYMTLLNSGWWPTHWEKSDGSVTIVEKTDQTLSDTIAWYDKMIADGYMAVRYEHNAERGVMNYVDGKWDNQIPEDHHAGPKKWRRTMLGFGPVSGEEGDIRIVQVQSCSEKFKVDKIIFTHDTPKDPAAVIETLCFGGRQQPDVFGKPMNTNECVAFDGSALETIMVTDRVEFRIRFVRNGRWSLVFIGEVLV